MKFVSLPRRLFLNGLLRLLLRADKQNVLAVHREIADEVVRLLELLDGLLQVDDVDAVSFREDVLRHLRVPSSGLVAEVDARLQKLLHRYYCHFENTSLVFPPPGLIFSEKDRLRGTVPRAPTCVFACRLCKSL